MTASFIATQNHGRLAEAQVLCSGSPVVCLAIMVFASRLVSPVYSRVASFELVRSLAVPSGR